MSMRSWIRNVFTRPVTRPIRRALPRARLAVEALEDRAVPAVITVTSLADNLTADGQVTLREAILAAQTDTGVDGSTAGSGADTIVFAPGLTAGGPATINLSVVGDSSIGNSAFLVSTPITLRGPAGSNGITLAGPGSSGVLRHFLVNGPGDLTVENLTLTGGNVNVPETSVSLANDGGSILLQPGGTVTLTNSTVANNAAADGGGIRLEQATLRVTGSTISGNLAGGGRGGGIHILTGTLTLTNTTVSGNSSPTTFGGGISNLLGTVMLTNCTVSGNSSLFVGGIFNQAGTLTLNNTIVANNSGENVNGLSAGSNNLFGSVPLGPLQNNGGPTATHALLPGSSAINPAINAGSNALIPAGVTTDQRGPGFPRISGGTVDIGAFEYQLDEIGGGVITVTSLADNLTADGQVTLREAILAAQTDTSADTIVFAPGLTAGGPATINLSVVGDSSIGNSAFLVSTPITLRGPAGSNGITLAGPGSSGVLRHFLVNGPGDLTVENLTLTGGNVNVPETSVSLANDGGSILLQPGGTVTLTNSTVANNAAADGGGIRLEQATLRVTGSTISGNLAGGGRGGGIHILTGTLTLTNTTVSGNSSPTTFGGGISNLLGTVMLTNCTVSGNSSLFVGGIFNQAGTLTLNNTIVANNSGENVNGLSAGSNNLFGSVPLGPLQNNGGPTATHALLPGSSAINPAINAGSNALIPAGVTTDQRGLARIVNDTVDIGAFEVQSNQAPTVTGFTKVGAEDNTMTFTAADFTDHYSDPDGDALAAVRIESVPASGILQLNGVAVTAGQVIAAADLSRLTFAPGLNFSGSVTFQYTASDGVAFAASAATITLDIRSAAQQAAALRDEVTALRDAGVLNRGQANSLLVKLYLQGNNGDSGKVQAFLNHVQAFRNAGILTQDQADALLVPGNILL